MTFSSGGGMGVAASPASLLLGGPPPCRDFRADAAASHQHFRGEASDRPDRAHHGQAEGREQDRRDGRIPQAPTNGVRTDAQVAAPPKAARRTAASSARDRRRKCDSCTARSATLPGSRLLYPLRNLVDAVSYSCQAGREHIQEGRNARQQENGGQCHLNDVSNHVER